MYKMHAQCTGADVCIMTYMHICALYPWISKLNNTYKYETYAIMHVCYITCNMFFYHIILNTILRSIIQADMFIFNQCLNKKWLKMFPCLEENFDVLRSISVV